MSTWKPGKLFFLGVGASLTGGLLLLLTTGVLPSVMSIWPGILILSGIYLLYRGYILPSHEGAVFIGFFLLLGGLTLVMLNTVMSWAVLGRMWPLFMMVLAVALFFYGLQKCKDYRAAYTVPAIGLFLLASFFLLFSLEIIETSFDRFISRWWPLTLIFLGLAVMLQNILKHQHNE